MSDEHEPDVEPLDAWQRFELAVRDAWLAARVEFKHTGWIGMLLLWLVTVALVVFGWLS